MCGVDLAITGLKIMLGHNGDVTGQKLHSPVMLTGHAIPPLVAMRNDVRGTFHRRSPIGFFDPEIPTQISCNPVIPGVIFGIPLPVHTFNPDSGPDFSLKSRIPSFKQGKSRILKNLLRTLSILMTLRYPDLGSFSDKLKICFIVITLFSRSLR